MECCFGGVGVFVGCFDVKIMFLFSLLPYKFGWADVELFFKMFGEYLGGVIPQGICNFRNLHLAFCQELLCTFHTDGPDEFDGFLSRYLNHFLVEIAA